jgi:dihydrofolate reductase
MRKIVSMMHLSLDSMASGPNDEINWVSYDKDLEAYAHSMHDRMDAVIWGRRTYEGMKYFLTVPGNPDSGEPERNHAKFLDESTKIVVSRTLDKIEWGGATNSILIKDNLAEQFNKLKAQPGKDMWLLGSTKLFQEMARLDLIDEYLINVNPIILGEGKPYFSDVDHQLKLKLLESNTLKSGVVTLRYERVRA